MVTVRIRSSASRSFTSTPARADRSVAIATTNGIASPRACGQAITRTAMAAVNAAVTPNPAPSQAPRVPTAIVMTMGTNTPEMRSASRCTGALPATAKRSAAASLLAILAGCSDESASAVDATLAAHST